MSRVFANHHSRRSEEGATAVEYGLLAALVVVVIMGAIGMILR